MQTVYLYFKSVQAYMYLFDFACIVDSIHSRELEWQVQLQHMMTTDNAVAVCDIDQERIIELYTCLCAWEGKIINII